MFNFFFPIWRILIKWRILVFLHQSDQDCQNRYRLSFPLTFVGNNDEVDNLFANISTRIDSSFLYFIQSNYSPFIRFHHGSPNGIILKFLQDLQSRFPRSPALQNSREFQEYTKSAIERIQTFLVLSRIGPAQDVEDRLGLRRHIGFRFNFSLSFHQLVLNVYPKNVSKINFKLLSSFDLIIEEKIG